jgi:hypothetical protein
LPTVEEIEHDLQQLQDVADGKVCPSTSRLR